MSRAFSVFVMTKIKKMTRKWKSLLESRSGSTYNPPSLQNDPALREPSRQPHLGEYGSHLAGSDRVSIHLSDTAARRQDVARQCRTRAGQAVAGPAPGNAQRKTGRLPLRYQLCHPGLSRDQLRKKWSLCIFWLSNSPFRAKQKFLPH